MYEYVNTAEWDLQFLLYLTYIFEASYSTMVTWAAKKLGLDQSELWNPQSAALANCIILMKISQITLSSISTSIEKLKILKLSAYHSISKGTINNFLESCTEHVCFQKYLTGKKLQFLLKTINRRSFQFSNLKFFIVHVKTEQNFQKLLHKKWSFTLRISSVNMTKSTVSCGFGHIYWRNP